MASLIAGSLSEPWRVCLAPQVRKPVRFGTCASAIALAASHEEHFSPAPHVSAQSQDVCSSRSTCSTDEVSVSSNLLRGSSTHSFLGTTRLPACRELLPDGAGGLESLMAAVPQGALQGEGDWTNAVLALVPYLNKEQIHQALTILDMALKNAQQVKALQEIEDSAAHSILTPVMASLVQTTGVMKSQVFYHQSCLLVELLKLRDEVRDLSGQGAEQN